MSKKTPQSRRVALRLFESPGPECLRRSPESRHVSGAGSFQRTIRLHPGAGYGRQNDGGQDEPGRVFGGIENQPVHCAELGIVYREPAPQWAVSKAASIG